jgi:hypothetical protein
MAVQADGQNGPSTRLLLGGGALTVLGLAVAAPAVARMAAAPLARRGGVASTLAGRRVAADPAAAGRVVTGTVHVVFVGAWLLAFLPVLGRYSSVAPDEFDRLLPDDTVLAWVQAQEVPSVLATVAKVPGTKAVAFQSVLLSLGSDGNETQVSVVRCDDLARLVERDLGCNGSPAYRVSSANIGWPEVPTGRPVPVLNDNARRIGTLTLPTDAPRLRWPGQHVPDVLAGGWLVEPSALPDGAVTMPGQLVVRQPGGRVGAERLRAARPADAGVSTLAEAQAARDRVYLGYLRAARIGIGLAVVVGALSLLVATVDGVRERRRGLAALVALGTPLRVLRRSVVVQIGVPLLANVLLALGAAAVASWAYLTTDEAVLGAAPLPWGSWALVGLGGVAAVLLAALVSLPFVRAVGRPEALRSE